VDEHWKVVFDVATNSLDFGSGFLDDEEVRALRAAAVDLGVDPMEATPHNFKAKYCPGHQPKTETYTSMAGGNAVTITRCEICDWVLREGEWKQW
jgi:hypothetical protein